MNKKNFFLSAILLVTVLTIFIAFAYRANQPELTPQRKTFKFLTENGFSDVQACGIMACMEISSNFNPAAEDLANTGYGLLFWTAQRKDALKKFADIQGKPIDDFQMQLDFLLDELQPDSKNYQLISHNGYTPEDFWNASTPGEAALSFCSTFERPHKNLFKNSTSDRILLANTFHVIFSN